MSLLRKIDEDLIKALKAGDKFKVTVLRGLKSDIKYRQIDKGEDLTEEDIIGAVNRAAKQRRDSIEQFKSGKRMDLVEKETAELGILAAYLPEQLSEQELRELIKGVINNMGAESPKQMGLVMKDLMPKIKGKADGKIVGKLVSELLSIS